MLCILLALLGATSNATGTVLQRKAALHIPPDSALRPRMIVALARQGVWVLGIIAVACAALFQALALATGPLALAQPVFILELPIALLVAMPLLRRRIPRGGWYGSICVVVGLGLALASAAPHGGRDQASMDRWAPVLTGCAILIGVCVAAAVKPRPGAARAALLGLAAAVGNAITAALIKSAANTYSQHGGAAFLAAWQTYAFAVCGVAATFLLENALQAGPLVASQPALTLGDASFSLVLGIVLYHERIRTGWWVLPALAGGSLVVLGTHYLGRAATAVQAAATRQPTHALPSPGDVGG